MTASFRALYERLIFQNLTYSAENPLLQRACPTLLLIMTSNAPDYAYQELMRNYPQTLDRFAGPTKNIRQRQHLAGKGLFQAGLGMVDL